MQTRSFLFFFLALWACSATTSACVSTGESTNAAVSLNIPYGSHPRQKYDFYKADEPSGALFIMFHGGGWRAGNKSDLCDLASFLARNGVDVAVPSYRLAPEHRYPAQIKDVDTSVRAIVETTGRPSRLILGGYSAGAHLASLLALRSSGALGLGDTQQRIDGLVVISGVFRIAPQSGGATPEFIESVFGADRDVWLDASPVWHLKKQPTVAQALSHLIIVGASEHPLIVKESRVWAAALRAAGSAVQYHEALGMDQSTLMRELRRPQLPLSETLLSFLLGL